MGARILVVDDEPEIGELVAVYLEAEGFDVERRADGAAARARVRAEAAPPRALAILDVMLPGASGLEVCRAIRERHTYPIIMLTARGEAADKISGLTLGADDYMTKPFLPLELVARVKAQLRRSTTYNAAEGSRAGDLLVCRGLTLDARTHEARLNERPLQLTPTEFSLLRILLEADGAVVSQRELYQRIFGDAYYENGSGSITVHVRHLREKMGDSFEGPTYIKTVWGCGYKIER